NPWEKLGRDLTRAQKEGNLPPGIMPIWSMIRECLDNHVGAAELERGAEELAKLKEERSKEHAEEAISIRHCRLWKNYVLRHLMMNDSEVVQSRSRRGKRK
ncbi:igE-binding protein-like, partial [Sigmodon hispidus]